MLQLPGSLGTPVLVLSKEIQILGTTHRITES